MNYPSEYPIMSTLEYENAPWNQKDSKPEIITANVSCSISFQVPLEVDKNNSYSGRWLFEEQYMPIEEILKFLSKYFDKSEIKQGQVIKNLAESAFVDEFNVEYD